MKPTARSRRREPELFLNRELSWLAFDQRVLEEAVDATNPLMERLKFAAIAASNLDEFFMVRVAALRHRVAEGDLAPDPAGLTPLQQLEQISAHAHELVERLYAAFRDEILAELTQHELSIQPLAAVDQTELAALRRYFHAEVLPALTPLAADASHPFPMLAGLSLNLALLLEPAPGEDVPRLAVVQVPARLPRLVRVPGTNGTRFVLLESIVHSELAALFPGQAVRTSASFRLTRDAEMELDDEGGRDYVATLEEELRKRRRGQAVRLEIEAHADPLLLQLLAGRIDIGPSDIYQVDGPLDLRAFLPLVDLPALSALRDAPLKPAPVLVPKTAEEHFGLIDERDILLVHPYEAFDPVVAFVTLAAEDPDVLAIKMTLYRTSGESPIVRALSEAAERGKQVTVLVELMARFDEQSNILWARRLEEAGGHVIYGIRGLKTHAKIALVVRRGRQGIRRYVHLGTGNYNERTARLYSDCGLVTADPVIGEDASAFFNALTGYSDPPVMRKLVMAPAALRDRLLRLVDRERRRAVAGQAAAIRAKMNSLQDEDIIRAFYDASRAGVRVRLNVRGICCLRPGLKGVSDHIEVVSIVDRFLEHARIFHFLNGGDDEVFLSSADWMSRNLDRRIELLFPVEDVEARRKVLSVLDAAFQENVKARWLQADGAYKRRRLAKGEEAFRSQLHLHRLAQQAAERARTPLAFEPLTSRATNV
jgi:polyphosphate kinase